ncbi:MAG: vitamin K epoxide reductase family protein [Anaerolineae bacterium]|nr:vitamin K epoxide reductase family protein [Anaerolineae bacterium]
MKKDRLRFTSFILTLIGLIDSLYLLWIKISQNKALCLPGLGDCWSVNTSRYSEIYGVPVSILGALAYLVILALLWLEGKDFKFKAYLPGLIFGITLTGTLYSAYLTYLEIAVIKAICPFCVVSAVVMTVLLIISTLRLRKTI